MLLSMWLTIEDPDTLRFQFCRKSIVSESVLLNAFGMRLDFKESSSRDTKENGANSWALLSKHGITRIALVTHTHHMPRASAEFKSDGFTVIEASVGPPTASSEAGLRLLPNTSSLELSQTVLRELLAGLIKKFFQK